jgi:transposase
MPAPYPREIRQRAVELALATDEQGNRSKTVPQVAKEINISESCLRNWIA